MVQRLNKGKLIINISYGQNLYSFHIGIFIITPYRELESNTSSSEYRQSTVHVTSKLWKSVKFQGIPLQMQVNCHMASRISSTPCPWNARMIPNSPIIVTKKRPSIILKTPILVAKKTNDFHVANHSQRGRVPTIRYNCIRKERV